MKSLSRNGGYLVIRNRGLDPIFRYLREKLRHVCLCRNVHVCTRRRMGVWVDKQMNIKICSRSTVKTHEHINSLICGWVQMHCWGRGRFSLSRSQHTPSERGRERERERNEGEGGRDKKIVKRGGRQGQRHKEGQRSQCEHYNKKKISSCLEI